MFYSTKVILLHVLSVLNVQPNDVLLTHPHSSILSSLITEAQKFHSTYKDIAKQAHIAGKEAA